MRFVTSLAICCFSLPVFALTAPNNFPSDLMYHGQPIDPLCFFEAESFNKSIALDKCGIQTEADRKIISSNTTDMQIKGIVGYEYAWPIDKSHPNDANAYSYYSVVGNVNGSYIVYTLNNSGGSGQFSGIYYVKREGDNLRVDLLTGGDRCNGGIKNVQYKDNKLTFSMNLTAYDLFDLAQNDPHHLKAYDHLSACAACCEAIANYSIEPTKSISNATLVSVDLGKEIIRPNKDSQGDHQYCFDSIVADYQRQGLQILTPQQVKELVQSFNTKCF